MRRGRRNSRQFHSGPNFAMCCALLLLSLVCLSTWMMSGLHAKYTTSDSGSDSARVIKFGEISITEMGDFAGDNKAIMIPNGTLSNSSIVNVTAMDKRRLDLIFQVAYDSDIQQVKEILTQVALGDEAILREEDAKVFVSELADSAVCMGTRCWVKKEDYWTAKWRITENVKLAFDENNIQIPFPQLDVNIKK